MNRPSRGKHFHKGDSYVAVNSSQHFPCPLHQCYAICSGSGLPASLCSWIDFNKAVKTAAWQDKLYSDYNGYIIDYIVAFFILNDKIDP